MGVIPHIFSAFLHYHHHHHHQTKLTTIHQQTKGKQMETTIITIGIIFIALVLIAAYIAYEMTHAYELPEDYDDDEDEATF